MKDLPYHSLYKSTSIGSRGQTGIEIRISSSALDLTQLSDIDKFRKLHSAAYDAAKLVEEELTAEIIAADPESALRAARERADLIGLFPAPIFVEAISNGYSNDAHSRHLPWFRVTTIIGHFIIGWRRRVINLDWSGTTNFFVADELFPAEDVTKDGRLIHAWSLDKAREYINTIMTAKKTIS